MSPEPRLPVPGEFVCGTGTLVGVVPSKEEPKPQPPAGDYLFRDVSARGEIRRRGKTLDTLGTDSDFYGLGRSVIGKVEEMKQYCAENEIAPGGECEVVVVRVIEYRRMRPRSDSRENLYAREFKSFEYLDCGSAWSVPETSEDVVWSSREPDKAPPELPPLPEVESNTPGELPPADAPRLAALRQVIAEQADQIAALLADPQRLPPWPASVHPCCKTEESLVLWIVQALGAQVAIDGEDMQSFAIEVLGVCRRHGWEPAEPAPTASTAEEVDL